MDWDFVIIGSGFGGSVSALRLTEKGYRVLVLEKGRRLKAGDFPESNWSLRRFLWLPRLGFRGLFKMTFLEHVTALSGVGVGGGSLVYANTLPVPKDPFFQAPSWSRLADWKTELAGPYRTVRRMLGSIRNPKLTYPDQVVREVGRELGREDHFEPTEVAVYFGQPGETVPDPYFGGEGPDRTGCILCGGCMLGCNHGAKNTLDQNYLYLAEKRGLRIEPDTEVDLGQAPGRGRLRSHGPPGNRTAAGAERPADLHRRPGRLRRGGAGHRAAPAEAEGACLRPPGPLRPPRRFRPDQFRGADGGRHPPAGPGPVPGHRPGFHPPHGRALPPRAGAVSGRGRVLPPAHAAPCARRTGWCSGSRTPWAWCSATPSARSRPTWCPTGPSTTMILLYMSTVDGHLRLRLGRGLRTGFRRRAVSEPGDGPMARAWTPEATDLGQRVARRLDGYPISLVTETLLGIPTTAHILGGVPMGDSAATGAIDHRHRLFGYDGLYVVDGSAISANPGVNPSLTIAALAERAMAFIPRQKGRSGPMLRSALDRLGERQAGGGDRQGRRGQEHPRGGSGAPHGGPREAGAAAGSGSQGIAHQALGTEPSGGAMVAAGPGLTIQNLQPAAVIEGLVREKVRIPYLAEEDHRERRLPPVRGRRAGPEGDRPAGLCLPGPPGQPPPRCRPGDRGCPRDRAQRHHDGRSRPAGARPAREGSWAGWPPSSPPIWPMVPAAGSWSPPSRRRCRSRRPSS